MASPAGFLAQETVDQGLANLALCLVLYSLQTKNRFYIFKSLGPAPPHAVSSTLTPALSAIKKIYICTCVSACISGKVVTEKYWQGICKNSMLFLKLLARFLLGFLCFPNSPQQIHVTFLTVKSFHNDNSEKS